MSARATANVALALAEDGWRSVIVLLPVAVNKKTKTIAKQDTSGVYW